MPINLKLANVAVGTPRVPQTWDNAARAYIELDPRDCFLQRFKEDDFTRAHVEIPEDADMYHRNFLEYLEQCWRDHLGIVVTPDLLWFTVMSEVASIIAGASEIYRHLFTDRHEKREITVVSSDLVVMPTPALAHALRDVVPTDLSLFMPEFSTTTPAARHARYTAFADLCSPYYCYSMMLCAFPAISVQGTVDDWAQLAQHWRRLSALLSSHKKWADQVAGIFQSCATRLSDATWWAEMFKLDRCGSGHQTVASGWVTELFHEGAKGPAYVSNFPSAVAKIEYRQIETRTDYMMREGLFYSRREGDFMQPDFGFVVHRKL